MLRSARDVLKPSLLQFRGTACKAAFSTRTTTSTKSGLPGDDTHDDFKPQVYKKSVTAQVKAEPSAAVTDVIKQDLESNKVFVYMKGEPEAPQCGFSNVACRILDAYRVQYGSRNVLTDPELRDAIKSFSQWPTIPQVYIKGEFVGGSDLLMEMHQKGELEGLLKDVGQQE